MENWMKYTIFYKDSEEEKKAEVEREGEEDFFK